MLEPSYAKKQLYSSLFLQNLLSARLPKGKSCSGSRKQLSLGPAQIHIGKVLALLSIKSKLLLMSYTCMFLALSSGEVKDKESLFCI